MTEWVKLTNIGSGFEADVLVERLRAAGLHAETRGDVGMFGPGFKGTTARGIDVLVLNEELSAAQEILDDARNST